MQNIGILSDTHGLLRPEAVAALNSMDVILHAGDVGSEHVLLRLRELAPVTAVRGNVDTGAWAGQLPLTASLEIGGVRFFLIHEIADLARYPAPAGTHVIVYGHSHKPSQTERDGICYLNPGSAGRRRFSLPVSLVTAQVNGSECKFLFVELLEKP